MRRPDLKAPLALTLLTLLAACRSGPEPTPTPTPGAQGREAPKSEAPSPGCPSMDRLRAIHLVYGDGEEREDTWAVHQSIVPYDADPFHPDPSSYAPEVMALTDADAAPFAPDDAGQTVWVYGASGQPACRMTLGAPMALRVSDGPTYTAVVRALEGPCDLPKGTGLTVGFIGDEAPRGCTLHKKRRDALTDLEAARALPLPDPFASALHPNACAAPACELRWEATSVAGVGGADVHQMIVSHVFPKPDEAECNWNVEDQWGILLRPAPGEPLVEVMEAYSLLGAFGDHTGLRAIVTNEIGVMQVHAPVASGEVLKKIVWYIAHEEDSVKRSMGPDCGP